MISTTPAIAVVTRQPQQHKNEQVGRPGGWLLNDRDFNESAIKARTTDDN